MINEEYLLDYVKNINDDYFKRWNIIKIIDIYEGNIYFSFRAEIDTKDFVYLDGGFIKDYNDYVNMRFYRIQKLKRILES